MQQLKEKIRALIMQNETDAAIDTLLEWAKSNYESLYNQCILLRARLEQIERENNTNLIAPEDAMRQVNQVNAALLNLISDVEPTSTEIPDSSTPTLKPQQIPSVDGEVQFPEGQRVTLVENGQEITYEILSAKIEPLNPQQLRLALQVRCLPKMAYGQNVNFWASSFRLACPDLPPLAPSNDLNLLAESGSYKDGPIEFLLPPQTQSGKVTFQFGSQTTQLSLIW